MRRFVPAIRGKCPEGGAGGRKGKSGDEIGSGSGRGAEGGAEAGRAEAVAEGGCRKSPHRPSSTYRFWPTKRPTTAWAAMTNASSPIDHPHPPSSVCNQPKARAANAAIR